jgi:hypothetical protein
MSWCVSYLGHVMVKKAGRYVRLGWGQGCVWGCFITVGIFHHYIKYGVMYVCELIIHL